MSSGPTTDGGAPGDATSCPALPPASTAAGDGWTTLGLALGALALGLSPVLHFLTALLAVPGLALGGIGLVVMRQRGVRPITAWVAIALNSAAIAVSVWLWFAWANVPIG